MRGLAVTLMILALILLMVMVVVGGKFMSFKTINMCVFKRTLCGQQLEARTAVKSAWQKSGLEVMMAWVS